MIYILAKGILFRKRERYGQISGYGESSFDKRWGVLYLEIIITLLSGILGVSSSIVYEVVFTILKRKRESKEDNITSRIKNVSTMLESSVQELGWLQAELEERVKMVEKLKE